MVRARTLALLPLVVAAPLLAPPLATAAPRPTTYVLPGDAVFPEGVTARGRTFYVTSTTDGTVFRGDVKSEDVEVFLPGGRDGRTTAIGLEISRQGATGSSSPAAPRARSSCTTPATAASSRATTTA